MMIKLEHYKKDEKLYLERYKEYLRYLNSLTNHIKVFSDEDILYYSSLPDKDIFLVYNEDDPIGIVILGHGLENCFSRHDVYIQDFYIFPEYQRTGLGYEVLKVITRHYSDKDFSLMIIKNNYPALNFWDKVFERIGYSERMQAADMIALSDDFYFKYYVKMGLK